MIQDGILADLHRCFEEPRPLAWAETGRLLSKTDCATTGHSQPMVSSYAALVYDLECRARLIPILGSVSALLFMAAMEATYDTRNLSVTPIDPSERQWQPRQDGRAV